MVDGIISQDSDCFAYGAVKVYRNFSVSTQGNVAAQGGSVDVYDINKVSSSIGGLNKSFKFISIILCIFAFKTLGKIK